MNNNPFLFVYGSLRQGFNSPAYEYIARYFNLVSSATVKGIMYDLGEYPAVVPCAEERWIVGELYQIKNERELNWAFVQLDDYEGVIVEQGETPRYVRAIADVYCNNQVLTAHVYWYNGSTTGLPTVPSGDIFEYLKSS